MTNTLELHSGISLSKQLQHCDCAPPIHLKDITPPKVKAGKSWLTMVQKESMLTTWRDSYWARLRLSQSFGNRWKVELIIPSISMKLLHLTIHADQRRHTGFKNDVIAFTQLNYPSCSDIRPDFMGMVWWHLVCLRPAAASFCQCVCIFSKQKIASLCGGNHPVNKMITWVKQNIWFLYIYESQRFLDKLLGWEYCVKTELNAFSLVSSRFQPYDSNELLAVLNHSCAEPDTC